MTNIVSIIKTIFTPSTAIIRSSSITVADCYSERYAHFALLLYKPDLISWIELTNTSEGTTDWQRDSLTHLHKTSDRQMLRIRRHEKIDTTLLHLTMFISLRSIMSEINARGSFCSPYCFVCLYNFVFSLPRQGKRQTDRWTDGRTDERTNRQTEGQTERQTNRQTDGRTDRDRQTYRQTNRHRQTEL